MSAYGDLLRDPRWQRKRLEVMARDEFACRWCKSEDKTLNVHHTYYLRGAAPWEYPNESLLTLCEDCHESRGEATRTMMLHWGGLAVGHGIEVEVIAYVRARIAQITGKSDPISIADPRAFLGINGAFAEIDYPMYLAGAAAGLQIDPISVKRDDSAAFDDACEDILP